ncbi:hypothetical protein [Pseudovibrio sp. SPO723]|uniref:hypothetical protein n=1 Tax=Nesiotobacter zosterae TaxID=392721 RepID=UPI0029C324F0|nr:hypothetical protein [Pseudovibrio sp. SPO723]MDX5594506.1 hypothetical protein [Pseudovibrio sp. SPO723]
MSATHALLSILMLVVTVSAASAQARPDTRTMTCEQARNLVKQRGAVVLTTGARTFDRFVVDRRFCQRDEAIRSEWVQTKDIKQCRIGYTCVRPYDFGIFD